MDNTFFKQSKDEFIIESNELINLYFGYTGSCYYTLNKVKIIPIDEQITIIYNINDYINDSNISSETIIRQCVNNNPKYINLIIDEKIVGTKQYLYNGSIIIKGRCKIIQNKEMIVDH